MRSYGELNMKMEDCNKFKKCHAPICPLDVHVHSSMYLDGEPICFYIREHVKGNDDDSEINRIVKIVLPEISKYACSAFRKVLKRVEKAPSKTKTKNLLGTSKENAPEGAYRVGSTEVNIEKVDLHITDDGDTGRTL